MIKTNVQGSIKKIIILLCVCIITTNYAREQSAAPHIWEGNLALPASQQPGALIALGQNIVDQHDTLGLFEFIHLKGNRINDTVVAPTFLYGITNTSSLFIRVPITTHSRSNNDISSGIGDITVQYEYAYLVQNNISSGLQGTVLANIGIPTGSAKKNPTTGFGSTSFFLGTTMSYLSIQWYGFLCAGATLTTSHHCNKSGNQFLYQGGFGKNIAYRSEKWILTGIIELDGIYEQRDKINKRIDRNSGGNTIFSNYTLWFSTQKLIAIAGISIPITQHLFGKQNKTDYFFEIILGWKFN